MTNNKEDKGILAKDWVRSLSDRELVALIPMIHKEMMRRGKE